MRVEWDDPVKYWQERSRRALESQGLVVPRLPVHHPSPEVIEIRRRGYQSIGLDLICNSCGGHIPKSTLVHVTIVYYSPYYINLSSNTTENLVKFVLVQGPVGSLHTRYSTRCVHCLSGLVLGRNIRDVETLVVISGATTGADEHNLHNGISLKPNNLQNEVKVSPLDPVLARMVMENLRSPTSRTELLDIIRAHSHPSVVDSWSDSKSDSSDDFHSHL